MEVNSSCRKKQLFPHLEIKLYNKQTCLLLMFMHAHCTYTHMNICTHADMLDTYHTCVHLHTHTHACTHKQIHIHTYTHTNTNPNTHVRTRLHTYIELVISIVWRELIICTQGGRKRGREAGRESVRKGAREGGIEEGMDRRWNIGSN